MKKILIISNLYLLFLFQFSYAQWPTAVDTGLYVDNGLYPYLVVDETDQSVIVTYLRDNGIRAKKFDKYGYPLWGGNTVVVSDTSYGWLIREISWPSGQWGAVISDGDGGAIVAWEDYRHATFDYEGYPLGSEVYLQRVDRDGNVLYGANGRQISGPASMGYHFIGDMKTDYNNGFYIGFSKDSTTEQCALRHFANNGNLLWQRFFYGSYIDVCTTNKSGEVFINTKPDSNLKRIKLDIDGNYLWPDTLIGIINDSPEYRHGGAFPDLAGGVIGVGGGGYLKIQRVLSSGNYAWSEVNLNQKQQGLIGYTTDCKGGIYVCWTEDSMRIQRVDKNGNVKFNPPVEILDTALGTHITHSDGGVITIFFKSGDEVSSLYAQKFDSSGAKLWPDSGLVFHTTDDDFSWWPPISIFSDMNAGAIFLWTELGQGVRIFIKQISYNGNLGEVTTGLKRKHPIIANTYQLYQNFPNPFNPKTVITYRLPVITFVNVIIYNTLGHRITTLVNQKQEAGTHSIKFDARGLSSGIYFYQLKTDTQTITKKMLLIQ